jgi:hypothetical protein
MSDESSSDNPYSGSWNSGGYTTGSNTNATNTDQATQAQYNYSSPLASNGSWQAGFKSGYGDTNTPSFDTTNTGGLAGLFTGNYGGYTTGSQYNITSPDQIANAQQAYARGDTPSLFERLGIVPGMTKEQYFNQETPSQKADRMGLVGNTIGAIGNAAMSTFGGPVFNLGLAGLHAYQAYQNNPSTGLGNTIASTLRGIGGYTGVAANTYLGNYGAAATGALVKNGVDSGVASAVGTGVDAATGKPVGQDLSGLAGYYTGRSVGGPVGGVLGSNLGSSLYNIFRK